MRRPEHSTIALTGRGGTAPADAGDLSAIAAAALLAELTAPPRARGELSPAEIVAIVTETLEARPPPSSPS